MITPPTRAVTPVVTGKLITPVWTTPLPFAVMAAPLSGVVLQVRVLGVAGLRTWNWTVVLAAVWPVRSPAGSVMSRLYPPPLGTRFRESVGAAAALGSAVATNVAAVSARMTPARAATLPLRVRLLTCT